jgi:hypothetical protein
VSERAIALRPARREKKTTHGSAQRREADEEVARRVEGAREPVAKVVKNGEKTTRERDESA